MYQPGSVFIQPDHRSPVCTYKNGGLPQVLEDLGPIRFMAVKCESALKPGISSPTVGIQVDYIDLAHKFRV